MDAMEEKLGNILNNPQMMQQIMAMAQSLGQSSGANREPAQSMPEPINSFSNIDPSMIQKLSGFAGQTGIDKEQQALLRALGPYLSRNRIIKLEKAMRAARMARFASAFLNSGGLQLLSGR